MKVCIIILASFTLGVVRASCKNDWTQFYNSCYLFIDEHVSWMSAQMICFLMGGKLLEVETPAENDFVVGQLHARPEEIVTYIFGKCFSTFISGHCICKVTIVTTVGKVWMGLQDFAREGTWVYTSNEEPAVYFNWARGQPNNDERNNEGGEDCVYTENDGTWHDLYCDNIYHIPFPPAVCCEAASDPYSVVG